MEKLEEKEEKNQEMIAIVTEDLDQADVEAAIAMFASTPRLVCVCVHTHTHTPTHTSKYKFTIECRNENPVI